MNLLREKLAARSAARLLGGGGGGGGSGSDAGGTGAPGTGSGSGMSAPSDTGGGMPGIGLGQTNISSLGLMGLGMLSGLPTAPLAGMATLGTGINSATGFTGGTPSSSIGTGGSMADPTGWAGPNMFPAEPQLDYDPRIAAFMGVDYARSIFQQQGGQAAVPGAAPGLPAFPGLPQPAGPAAAPPIAAPGTSSPEADALRQAQLDLVNQQRNIASEMLRRQNLLEGSLLGSQGLEQVLGPNGEITGYKRTASAQAQQDQQDQIANLLRTRTLSALNGQLPVDPALEREIGQNRSTLEAQLRGNLGTGYATSTPGIQSLADFDKRAEELREGMRRDTLTSGEGIRLAGEDLSNRISSNRFSNVVGLSQLPGSAAGVFSQAGSGLTPSLQNLLGYGSLGTQMNLGNLDAETRRAIAAFQGAVTTSGQQQTANAQSGAGWGSLLGTLGSAAISHPDSLGTLFGGIGTGLSNVGTGIGNFFGGLFGGG